MMYRNYILILALLALSVVAFAQPSPNVSWLRVSVQNSDGTPFSVAPAVSLVMPVAVVTPYNVPKADGLDVFFLDLLPGTYGLNIILRGTTIVIPPQTIEITRGANFFIWKLDPPITVTGEFTLDGKKPVAVNNGLAYEAKKGLSSSSVYVGGVKTRLTVAALNDTFKVNSDGKYSFTVITPGTYYLKFYTDHGYCDTATFIIPEGTKAEFSAPMVTLTPGGNVELTIKDSTGKSMPQAAVYFTSNAIAKIVEVPGKKSHVPYVPAPTMIRITANDNGVITTPQLPVGKLNYYVINQTPDPNAAIATQLAATTDTMNTMLGSLVKATLQIPK